MRAVWLMCFLHLSHSSFAPSLFNVDTSLQAFRAVSGMATGDNKSMTNQSFSICCFIVDMRHHATQIIIIHDFTCTHFVRSNVCSFSLSIYRSMDYRSSGLIYSAWSCWSTVAFSLTIEQEFIETIHFGVGVYWGQEHAEVTVINFAAIGEPPAVSSEWHFCIVHILFPVSRPVFSTGTVFILVLLLVHLANPVPLETTLWFCYPEPVCHFSWRLRPPPECKLLVKFVHAVGLSFND